MKKTFEALQVLAALFFLSVSSQSYAADLLQAYRDAVENDINYQAKKYRVLASQEEAFQSRSFFFPRIDARFNASLIEESLVAPNRPFVTQGNEHYDSQGYEIELRQALYDKSLAQSYRKSKLELLKTDLESENVKQALIMRVARAYFNLGLAKEQHKLAEAILHSSSFQRKQIKARFDDGVSSQAEYRQAYAREQRSISEEIQSRNALENAKRVLESITGKSYLEINTLTKESELEAIQSLYAKVKEGLDTCADSNLLVQLKEIDLSIADREVSIQRAEHYPTVDLVVKHSSSEDSGSLSGVGLDYSQSSAMVQLNMPIFSGGLISNRVRTAVHTKEAIQSELQALRSAIKIKALALIDKIENQMRTVNAFENAASANLLALESMQEGYRAGTVSYIDVLNAQRELQEINLSLLQSKFDSLALLLESHKISGSLDVSTLMSINALLR